MVKLGFKMFSSTLFYADIARQRESVHWRGKKTKRLTIVDETEKSQWYRTKTKFPIFPSKFIEFR